MYDRLGTKGLQAAYDKSFAAFQAMSGSAAARKEKRAAAHAAMGHPPAVPLELVLE